MALYTAALHCTSVTKTVMLISREFGKGHPDFGHSSSGHPGPRTFRSSRRPGLLDVQFSELCNFHFLNSLISISELCNFHFLNSPRRPYRESVSLYNLKSHPNVKLFCHAL